MCLGVAILPTLYFLNITNGTSWEVFVHHVQGYLCCVKYVSLPSAALGNYFCQTPPFTQILKYMKSMNDACCAAAVMLVHLFPDAKRQNAVAWHACLCKPYCVEGATLFIAP